jgi:NAD(P)H-dependent flavin oxidoreductase YrpB (nitropropane dioxygenase family)
MRTPVCELLGIEQPIVLAPMVEVPRLAAAVSNAPTLPTGDIEALSMWAGQSVALARQPQSAAEIVAELTSLL